MNATQVLAAGLVLAFGVLGSAKLAAVPAMQARARHVGFSIAAYRRIGALEVLGAAGFVAGMAYAPIAVAAGAGLVLLLAGAVVTHLRNGDGLREVAPAVVLGLLASTFVVLTVGSMR
jgi:hypothetical protein